jgi:hypothetical protein
MGKKVTFKQFNTIDDFVLEATYKSNTKEEDFYVDIVPKHKYTDKIKANACDDSEVYDMRFEFIEKETISEIYKKTYIEQGAMLKDNSEVTEWIKSSLNYISKLLSKYNIESELEKDRLKVHPHIIK